MRLASPQGIYRGKDDPHEYWISLVFPDESSYKKNADDPVQNQWFGELMKLLESEPEWYDGEVVHAAHTHCAGTRKTTMPPSRKP